MKNFLSLTLLILFVSCCSGQVVVSLANRCQCQLFSEKECTSQNTFGLCNWNNSLKQCTYLNCTSIQSSTQCLLNSDNCFWNGNQCQQFTSCSKMKAVTNIYCSEMNIQCGGNSGQCVELSSLPPCYSYQNYQCGQPGYQIGQDGEICFQFSPYYCSSLSSCYQLNYQYQCQQLSNFCFWNGAQCVNAQCSYYQSQQECKNIFIINYNNNNFIPCIYLNNQCVELQSSNLNQENCSSLTFFNYRWVQGNSNGLCLSCQIEKQQLNLLSENSCPCDLYNNKSECISNSYCQWTTDGCQEINCYQITNQQLCIENYSCSWQDGECTFFSGCNLNSTSREECLLYSLNCQAYNPNNQSCALNQQINCSNYNYYYNPSFYCSYYTNGYCSWVNNQCVSTSQCGQINNYTQCNQYSFACQWINNQCINLTCNDLNQNKCKFVQTTLYQITIQPCIWIQSEYKCQNLQQISSLSENTCAINTDYTYLWAGTECVSCKIINALRQFQKQLNQCPCSYLTNQNDCELNQNCQWTGQCIYMQCNSYTDHVLCSQNKYCVWQNNICQNFNGCQNLQGTSQVECISQTINCPASNGNKCQSIENLQDCSNYSEKKICEYSVAKNGQCIWQYNQCLVLSQCSQITSQSQCTGYIHSCFWNVNAFPPTCQQASCSMYQSPSDCLYYYPSVNSLTPIGCFWNSNKCVQTATVSQLNQNTCFSNTAGTSHWNQNLNLCIPCQNYPIPSPFQCQCAQLISQTNCNQMISCEWNQTTLICEQKTCAGLDQINCIQNPSCMFISGYCQDFTSCSNLRATSIRDCAMQSIYCQSYNSFNGKCESFLLNYQKDCSEYTNQQQCQNTYNYNNILKCQWNYNYNRCEKSINCQQYSQLECDQIPTCVYFGNQCLKQQCAYFSQKKLCTFVLDMDNGNFIQTCEWYQGSCRAVQNHQSLNQQNCLTNTNYTWRWSSNTNTGFCVPCQLLNAAIAPKNQCSCAQILNQNECVQKRCQWYNNYCVDNFCQNISLQADCLYTPGCFWDIKYSSCQTWGIDALLNPCTKLQGQNSLECLSQSLQCPVSLNGVCQDETHLVTCSSYQNQQICTNSIGQEGLCNYKNQQCEVLTQCNQLTTMNQCEQFTKICQWVNNGCTKLFCSSITIRKECTYVIQSLYDKTVELCQWNINTNSCQALNYIANNKTQQSCFFETGGTYHWSTNNAVGSCVTCEIFLLQFSNTCTCNSLSELDCNLAFPNCIFSSNKCGNNECQNITNSIDCSQSDDCMWQNGLCTKFTSCNDLFGNTSIECYEQSKKCAGINNRVCQATSVLGSCSSQNPSQQLCNFGSFGQDGFCQWNTQSSQCDLITNCSQLKTITQCNKFALACKWSTYFSNCVPFECQDFKHPIHCGRVIVNLSNPEVQLCIWQNEVCQPFDNKNFSLNEETCYENSAHTYRWVSSAKLGEQCQQCSYAIDQFVQFIYVLVILLLIG